MRKIGVYVRLSEDVVEWLRRSLPAKKGSLSSYIEELIRRDMAAKNIDMIYSEIERLMPNFVESKDVPRLQGLAEKRLRKEL